MCYNKTGDNMKKRRKIRIKKKNVSIFLVFLIILIIFIMILFVNKDFKVELKSNIYSIGSPYDKNFKAIFKKKDVTKEVVVTNNITNDKIGKYVLTFKYNNGKKDYIVKKNIELRDTTEPKLTLNSGETMMIVINNKYSEPGYNAIDNYDGDLTSKVKVSGSVDTKKEGTYNIAYTVEDNSGNKTIKKRKVTVTDKSPLTMSLSEFTLNGYFMESQLKETKAANSEYIDNTIFAGDSTALYYVINKMITGRQLWHKEGVSLETIFTQNIYINHLDSKMTLLKNIENKKPSRILLSLGTNSVATMEISYFVKKYEELLKRIKEVSPNTKIIVQSIFPVAKSLDISGKALNNDKINKMNYYLLELCNKLNIPFLNTEEVLKGPDGTLKEGYYRTTKNENGVHLSQEGNRIAMEYFKNHEYKN